MKVLRAAEAFYMVRVDRGEEVVESLLRFAREHAIPCGAVTGLGGVRHVRLAYFDTQRKEYLPREFAGDLELVSLTGNLGRADGAPHLHAHVLVSDREFRCHAGHLLQAEVAVTAEFAVRTGEQPIQRVHNEELGILEQRFESR